MFFGDSNISKDERMNRSVEIGKNLRHLSGTGVLWTQWLARLAPETTQEMYRLFGREADTLIARVAQEQTFRHIHLRVYNWLKDMLIGGRFFLAFLEQCTEIQGAQEIQRTILQPIEDFVTERLTDAETLALHYLEHRGGPTQQDSLTNKIGAALYQEVHAGRAHWIKKVAKDSKDGKVPEDTDMPEGYDPVPDAGYTEIEAGRSSYRAGGVELGVITRDYLYIDSKVFHPFLDKHIKNCPSKLDCLRALEQAGVLIIRQGKDKKRYDVQIGSERRYYFKVRTPFVYGEEESEKPEPAPEPAIEEDEDSDVLFVRSPTYR